MEDLKQISINETFVLVYTATKEEAERDHKIFDHLNIISSYSQSRTTPKLMEVNVRCKGIKQASIVAGIIFNKL